MTALARLGQINTGIEAKGRATSYLNYAIALALCEGKRREAAELFATRWPTSIHTKEVSVLTKAAIAPATTTDTTWASPLTPLNPLSAGLVELLQNRTALGPMRAAARIVPFNISVARVTAGSSARWVGQAQAAPVSRMSLDTVNLKVGKLQTICPFSRELAKLANPAADGVIRGDITTALANAVDAALLDPRLAEVADVSPASVTYGAPTIASVGVTMDSLTTDLRNLFAQIQSTLTAPFFIMKPSTAIWIATLQMESGMTPTLGPKGGTLLGVDVIVSANTPNDSNSPSNTLVILIDAAEMLLAETGVEFSVATHATLEMDDSPSSPPTASTIMRSLWQENLLAIMGTHYVRWQMRRSGAVAVMTGVPF